MGQCAEISAHLRGLADDLLDADGSRMPPGDLERLAVRVGRALHQLADRPLVVLPAIDPGRDDLRHWIELDDTRLADEIHADAYNLAAGVYVQADRVAQAELRGTS